MRLPWGWMLAVAKVGAVQQISMSTRNVGDFLSGVPTCVPASTCSVYPPGRTADDVRIHEVLFQRPVVGEKQAGSTDLSQRQDMDIVRMTNRLCANLLFGRLQICLEDSNGTTSLYSRVEKPLKVLILCEFAKQSTTDDDNSSIAPAQPVSEIYARLRRASAKQLMTDIVINDDTHL